MGDPCYFDRAGFGWYNDGIIQKPIPALGLPVAYAVTASSAFPPLFPPVEISDDTLSCDHVEFEHAQRLTDGGVYDNLGIEALLAKYKEGESAPEQQVLLGTVIISDAEGNFDADFETKYSFPVNRNVRASDLLMKRVSILQLEDFEGTSEEDKILFVRVKIREPTRDLDDKTVLDPMAQRALINVRTDLDCFSSDEVTALIAHGYSKAREALLDKGLVEADAPRFSWDPLGNWERVKAASAGEMRSSRLRKWRLWSSRDPISWLTLLYAFVIFLILVTPTAFLARKVVNAQAATTAARVQAVQAEVDANQSGLILKGLLSGGGVDTKKINVLPQLWQLRGVGDCTGGDVDKSEGQFPLDRFCTEGGKAKTAVCWDGINFKNQGDFSYSAAWCTYKTTTSNNCSGGGAPGRLYQCNPTSGPDRTLQLLRVCVGDNACPSDTSKLSCGTSVQDWAKEQCQNFAVTQCPPRTGSMWYNVFQVALAEDQPTPTPTPTPTKQEITRLLRSARANMKAAV